MRAESIASIPLLSLCLAVLPVLSSACARPPEGRPWIATLRVRGVHNVSKRVLEHGLASRPVPWWHPGPVHLFDELELARDRLRVKRFYEQNGYYAAKVVLASATPRPGGAAVDVVISVEEGPPTFIGDFKVMGLGDVDALTRARVHGAQGGLRRGQVFHHADYERLKGELLQLMRRMGFPRARITGLVDIVPAQNLANITLTIDASGSTPADSPSAGVAVGKQR